MRLFSMVIVVIEIKFKDIMLKITSEKLLIISIEIFYLPMLLFCKNIFLKTVFCKLSKLKTSNNNIDNNIVFILTWSNISL